MTSNRASSRIQMIMFGQRENAADCADIAEPEINGCGRELVVLLR